MTLEFTKSEAKAWARQHYKGLQNIISPSFTPDMQGLDEEGIRWDVNYNIKQGVFAILASTDLTTLSMQERKRFVEIVCDEARGRAHVVLPALCDDLESDRELIRHFEKVGGTSVLLGFPVNYYPENNDDIFETFKATCDQTSLAIEIYPAHKYNFEKFHNSSFDPRLVERMADIPNVVAMKIGVIDNLAFAGECFRLVNDKILVNWPLPDGWTITVPRFGQQWSGAATNTTKDVAYFKLLTDGKTDEAMKLYWELRPMHAFWSGLLMRYAMGGIYPLSIYKYCEWLMGGNGGMVRQPQHRLYEHEKRELRHAMQASGIALREAPDEEYYIGRTNFAKGLRLKRRG